MLEEEAVKLTKATHESDDRMSSTFSGDCDSVRTSSLLQHAQDVSCQVSSSASSASDIGYIAEEQVAPVIKSDISMSVFVTMIQALVRGYACRKHHKRSEQPWQFPRRSSGNHKKQQRFASPPPTFSDSKRRALERQASEITMSDFEGDSTHHSLPMWSSQHSTCVSIREGDEEMDDDDEDYLDDDGFHLPIAEEVYEETASLESTLIDSSAIDVDSFETFDRLKARRSTRSPNRLQGSYNSLPVSSSGLGGDIRMTTAMGHASMSSYFGRDFLMDTPLQRPVRRLSPPVANVCEICRGPTGCTCSHSKTPATKSFDEEEEASLADLPFEDLANSLGKDDEESLQRFDLHRSEGSLDFFGDLKRRPATFRRRTEDIGHQTLPTSWFHLYSTLSLSFPSRWDDSVRPSPTTVMPSPQQQRLASKAAISTFLPVRPPSRKLSPMVPSAISKKNHGSYSSMRTALSSPTSAEASPQLPLRKSSTHAGVARSTSRDTEDTLESNSPEVLTEAGHHLVPPRNVEASPKIPVRKPSTHGSAHSTIASSSTSSRIAESERLPRTESDSAAQPAADRPICLPERKLSELPTSQHSSDSKGTAGAPTASKEDDRLLSLVPLQPPSSEVSSNAWVERRISPRNTSCTVVEEEESATAFSSSSPKNTSFGMGSWVKHIQTMIGRRSKYNDGDSEEFVKPAIPVKANIQGPRNKSCSTCNTTATSDSAETKGQEGKTCKSTRIRLC